LGINRLSIGIQSFNDGLLKKLGRVHSASEAIKAAQIAKQAGFDNFNLDLMFGLPDETDIETSKADVATAVSLQPTHISLYQLTLEPDTYFYHHPPRLPDDSVIFSTQEHCQAILAEHGYAQYEISAYSQAGKRCRHNTNYWQFGDYLGIGAGAHGKITQALPNNIWRTAKTKSPELYLSQQLSHHSAELIAVNQLPVEFLMNQLRLRQGFCLSDYTNNTGLSPDSLQPALAQCLEQKLLIEQNNRYYCSEKGWNFLDNILEKFIV
jgi:oxygen-independent coproporphyrinogen-3 oxidase